MPPLPVCLQLVAVTALLGSLPRALGAGEKAHGDARPGVDCEALGFSNLVLCSDCDVMSSYVKVPELLDDCKRCCAAETGASSSTYSSAVIEVCKLRLPSYPHVGDFLNNKLENFGDRIKVKHKYGAYPQIIFKSSDGKAVETVRVDNWKVEHFEEFLSRKLSKD